MATKGSVEKRALVQSLSEMFPDAPVEYLEQECQDIIGKPMAIDRFVVRLAASNGQPPDNWQHQPGVENKASRKRHIPEVLTVCDSDDEPWEAKAAKTSGKGEQQLLEADETHEEVPTTTETANGGPVPGPSHVMAGTSTGSTSHEVRELVLTLAAIFPDTSLSFLEDHCKNLVGKPADIDRFVTDLATSDPQPLEECFLVDVLSHPWTETEEHKADQRLVNLIAMFPSVDPEFLQNKANEFSYDDGSEDALLRWINTNIDKGYKNFPTRADYEKRTEQLEMLKQKANMSINEIFDMYETAEEYFQDPKRDPNRDNEMRSFVKDLEEQRQKTIKWAREVGILMECKCCYADDCLEEEMLPCQGGHFFCKECIQRGSKVAIGDGKTQLKCLVECDQVFKLSTLQTILKANVFSKWLKKIQVDELERAGVEGLEQCPFCPFATIMNSTPEDNKIFKCQNSDCAKESCRLCHEMSHIPQRCEEVEKDAATKKRTKLEEKRTEALVRKCYKCKKPYVKMSGCNHITCSCGAQMCYMCSEPWPHKGPCRTPTEKARQEALEKLEKDGAQSPKGDKKNNGARVAKGAKKKDQQRKR